MDINQRRVKVPEIDELAAEVTLLHREAGAKMNARYDEFEHFDADYPDGCIGDPESLVNEALVGAYAKVLRLINLKRGKGGL
tara:strand:+ start:2169 stop:2414 length:246 start_codon:yes stop_codon:yes gene_type:complete